MKLRTILFVFIIGLLAMLVGCGSSPVLNVKEAAITSNTNSVSEIKFAIIQAGSRLGWRMQYVGSGHIVGVLHLRKHMAKIDIKYDKKTYSITYNDSNNFFYNPGGDDFHSGPIIHNNYNGWIQRLDRGIKTELMNL